MVKPTLMIGLEPENPDNLIPACRLFGSRLPVQDFPPGFRYRKPHFIEPVQNPVSFATASP
jgi:hypothetical protein